MPKKQEQLHPTVQPELHTEYDTSVTDYGNPLNCVFVVDPAGRLVDVNKTAAALSGIENPVGKSLFELPFWHNSPKGVPLLTAGLAEALMDRNVQFETSVVLGSIEVEIEVDLLPITQNFNSQDVDYVIITTRNITEFKAYQQELERIYSSYNSLINANLVGMFVVDSHGNLTDVNTAFTTLLNYSPDQFMEANISWHDLFAGKSAGRSQQLLKSFITRSSLEPVEKELRPASGEAIPVILTGVKINNRPARCLCLIIDISERKKLENKKDEFMSIVSHELKTPITTLKGYVQLIEFYLKAGRHQDLSEPIVRINAQIGKMIKLVEDLLNASRLDMGKLTLNKKAFDIVRFIHDKLKDARSLYPDLEIELQTQIDAAQVNADPLRIEQVFLNLIGNAVKYSPHGQKVIVHIKRKQDYVFVEVQDFGVGIEKEKIPFLFDKYYRDVNKRLRFTEGLGLGLYISAEILKQHEGSIYARSKVNSGSTFYFSLPLYKSSPH